jgi:hypothetical protein
MFGPPDDAIDLGHVGFGGNISGTLKEMPEQK